MIRPASQAQGAPPGPLLVWPLPALLAWALAWAAAAALAALGMSAIAARGTAAAALALAALHPAFGAPWRRLLVALGYPAALAASGALAWPGWVWIAALAALAVVYPMRTWRDAPWFPTPARALQGLATRLPLDPDVRILDAGCGLGHALAALRREWPAARLEGLEWSAPLRLICAWRCRGARVRGGDMWAAHWSPYALVYLFQRPETIARALAKAEREMAPGSWLASLEFAAPQRAPDARLDAPGGRPLLLYRIGAAQPRAGAADKAPRTAARAARR